MKETKKEIWEDTSGGKWDVSFCLNEVGTAADLEVYGVQAGVGDFRISCSDYIPKFASGHITEENYGFIHGVEVRSDIRCMGVGSSLVEYVMEWMKGRGCKGCGGMLKDDQDNEARERFWARLGFALLHNKDGKKWIKRSID